MEEQCGTVWYSGAVVQWDRSRDAVQVQRIPRVAVAVKSALEKAGDKCRKATEEGL